jgi:dTMP kinase
MLLERLQANGYDAVMVDFPQYSQKSAGLVEEYLNGKYGDARDVGPYRASIFYACDRYDASFDIKKWLAEGKIIISNRYVTANMGHQGGKIKDPAERKAYLDWLYDLEYRIFGIPKPDINIILHVDAAVAQRLVDNKGSRDYVGGIKRDIHEADIGHLRDAEKVYLEIAQNYPDFKLIECTRSDTIMSREEIHAMIWNEVVKLIDPYTYHDLSPNFISQIYEPKDRPALKIQRLTFNAKLPTRAHSTDAGLDLYASEYYTVMPGERARVNNGIRIAIPEGYAGLIWDKSGISTKNGVHTIAGVIDSGYRGELAVNIINLGPEPFNIIPGQKIAQLLIQKIEQPEILETEVNDNTDRGSNGYGSSGIF